MSLLPLPSRRARAAAAVLALAGAGLFLACGEERDAVPIDTVPVLPLPPEGAPPAPAAADGWDPAIGPGLLIRSGPESALVVAPMSADTAGPAAAAQRLIGSPVEVFGRGGFTGTVEVAGATVGEGDGCLSWPVAEVQPPPGRRLPSTWSLGVVGGRARPIEMDSLEALPAPDSARLAAEITRIASRLPEQASAGEFRGLPFSVRTAYRSVTPAGRQVLVADLVRRLAREADPLEEHTLLVAERDTGAVAAPWSVGFFERTAGREEQVLTSELLAGILLGPADRPLLALQQVAGEGVRYALLERSPSGQWRWAWRSPLVPPC